MYLFERDDSRELQSGSSKVHAVEPNNVDAYEHPDKVNNDDISLML